MAQTLFLQWKGLNELSMSRSNDGIILVVFIEIQPQINYYLKSSSILVVSTLYLKFIDNYELINKTQTKLFDY